MWRDDGRLDRVGVSPAAVAATWAPSPIRNLSLVNVESVVICCRQAWRVTDRAVDVDESAARPADEMVMVVPHPVLEASRRADRLDAPEQACGNQGIQGVVDRLTRDCPDVPSDRLTDLVRGAVRLLGHGTHHRNPLGSHLHAVGTQASSRVLLHGPRLGPDLDWLHLCGRA